jgi:hypothetical protein
MRILLVREAAGVRRGPAKGIYTVPVICCLIQKEVPLRMPYRWKTKIDVDETIVVIMNVLDQNPELPNWLVNTVYGAIRDSDPAMVKYFYAEVKKFKPGALKYFEEGSTRTPI